MPYTPHTEYDRTAMLSELNLSSTDELFREIPENLRVQKGSLSLPNALSEYEIEKHLFRLSRLNRSSFDLISFLGAGMYDRYIPSTVSAMISRGEFLTAYTPYQPEASQGSLQTIYEFQTMIAELFGTDLANASMYDGATSMAEAAIVAHGINGRNTIAVSDLIHPHHRQVLNTYCWAIGLKTEVVPSVNGVCKLPEVGDQFACIVVGHPNFLGNLEDLSAVREWCNASGSQMIVSTDPIACALLKPPGEFGADFVVGEGQCLGVAMGLGGPAVGLFGCKQEHIRRIPGRIVGKTKEVHGDQEGYVMTLRTREQDIRREKATSNICTNEALMALANTVYLCAVGKNGIKQVAEASLRNSRYLQSKLEAIGMKKVDSSRYFCEFAVDLGKNAAPIVDRMLERGFLAGLALGEYYPARENQLLVATTEKRNKEEIDQYVSELAAEVGR